MDYKHNLVSIMIPCYNGELYLYRLFDSLLIQSYQRMQIIFVNDGSVDRTEEITLKYKIEFESKNVEFIYVCQENKGQASAINAAIPYIKGEYLMWIDCDDYLELENVEKKVSFLQQHAECNVVMSKGNIYKEDNLSKIVGILGEEKGVGSIFEDVLFSFRSCQCGLYMVRTKELFQVIPKNQIYESDAGQNMQLLLPILAHNKMGYIEDRLYNYIEYKASHSHAIYGGLAWKKRYDVLEDMKRNVLNTIPLNVEYKEALICDLEMQMIEFRLFAVDKEVDNDYAEYVCNSYLEKNGVFKNVNGRRLYIWGKGKRAEVLEGLMVRFTDVTLAGYIDSSLEKRNEDNSILAPEAINREKMFILIPLARDNREIVNILNSKGFVEGEDFVYPVYRLRKSVEGRKDAYIF